MSEKNQIQKDAEQLTDKVLEQLGYEDRTRLAIEYAAKGDDQRVEQLVDSALTSVYEGPEPFFTDRLALLETVAVYALWEIHTAAKDFSSWTMLAKKEKQLKEAYPDDDSVDYDHKLQQQYEKAAKFLIQYNAWKKFAEEEIDVTLTELLKFPFSDGIDDTLEEVEMMRMLANGSMHDLCEDGDSYAEASDLDVEQLTEEKYELIKSRV